MPSLEQKRLVAAFVANINTVFVPPFVDVPVRAWTTDEGNFCLKIQGRDMSVRADGSLIGCGTVLGCDKP